MFKILLKKEPQNGCLKESNAAGRLVTRNGHPFISAAGLRKPENLTAPLMQGLLMQSLVIGKRKMPDNQYKPPQTVDEAVLMAARRILRIVRAAYAECDESMIALALSAASGMASASHKWPERLVRPDFEITGISFGCGARAGFDEKTQAALSDCRGKA